MKPTNNISTMIGATLARIARRYTLPTLCPITHDDLIQEAYLALLETNVMSLSGELNSPSKVYAIARKAMQSAIIRYVNPVTRSLDATRYIDDNGIPITLADTIPDTLSDIIADNETSPSLSEALWDEGLPRLGSPSVRPAGADQAERREQLRCHASGGEGAAFSFLASLDSQLAAGTITPANYRQKKHRFLKKLRQQLSQNPKYSVYI